MLEEEYQYLILSISNKFLRKKNRNKQTKYKEEYRCFKELYNYLVTNECGIAKLRYLFNQWYYHQLFQNIENEWFNFIELKDEYLDNFNDSLFSFQGKQIEPCKITFVVMAWYIIKIFKHDGIHSVGESIYDARYIDTEDSLSFYDDCQNIIQERFKK